MRPPACQRLETRSAVTGNGTRLTTFAAMLGMAALCAAFVAPLPVQAFFRYSELGIVRDVNPDLKTSGHGGRVATAQAPAFLTPRRQSEAPR